MAYIGRRRLAGYGDKLRRVIGAADPGAVPGGSTRSSFRRVPDGAEPGSTCVEKRSFRSEWDHRDGPYTSANDNEALAIAA
ncbi:hypothetical protein SCH01S_25_00750 [Sphingomonas changbaiensis NBRC 104936]|uniref:Uncharacterized protein n=1 Tax=Sphingomonas changbaiensis NBRC 104936 TaxID=1219043 RepID=A0A0E9MPN9_9SPHN|nr:hypothetical protein SCH01S_25_00750 [Sphingomonas changbaiensis NBRC 104936]